MKTTYAMAIAAGVAIAVGATLSVRAAEIDDRIESTAKQTYVFRTYLKDDSIRVESKEGVVTLTGTVSEESHKSLAEDTVKRLPGVTDVVNRLEVKEPKPAAMSDDWISAKVKMALLFHRSVSAHTQVHVKDGVVTLTGTANSQAEKELATEYAKDIEGVKDVDNKMTVSSAKEDRYTMGERIDDASITTQVKAALAFHRSTSALRTEVDTTDAVVTLRGTAKNQAEKDLVTKLTRDIKGVKDVKNEMTIGG